jgi:peptidyl-prolyl cis-trans isomerase C
VKSAAPVNTAAPAATDPHPGVWRYHLLRAALEQFQRRPAELSPEQAAKVEAFAERSYRLESQALASAEAQEVVIDPAQVQQAVAQVAQRFAERGEFLADLARNDLDEETLTSALYRELRFDAVLRRVGSQRAEVTEADIQAYYRDHPERFNRPERRHARHILITLNPDYPENRREAVQARIQALAAQLAEAPTRIDALARFEALARQHSECPTALEGGRLGAVTRGQLYPELDAALFALAEGAISGVLESPLGLHLILCEGIEPAQSMALEDVRETLRQRLDEQRRHQCQRDWLHRNSPASY